MAGAASTPICAATAIGTEICILTAPHRRINPNEQQMTLALAR